MDKSEIVFKAIRDSAVGAVGALRFITLPDVWPAFAAWAEQQTPGDMWGETDRQELIEITRFLTILAREWAE